ncbi:MAG: hypothetical protein LBF71_02720 [Campylobacteraceae bacterium]|jgi:hypothetical protein|nr:hypothetical protein [Campylobacteraceae bacterium]
MRTEIRERLYGDIYYCNDALKEVWTILHNLCVEFQSGKEAMGDAELRIFRELRKALNKIESLTLEENK